MARAGVLALAAGMVSVVSRQPLATGSGNYVFYGGKSGHLIARAPPLPRDFMAIAPDAAAPYV
jgi:hypothetical protein